MEFFNKNDSKQRQMELRLRFFGSEQCAPLHSWGPGLRDIYIVHYVVNGKGQFSTGGETYQLSEGQGFLITPNTLVHYAANETDPWTYSWIGFDGLHARAFMQRAGLSVSQPVFNAAKPPSSPPGTGASWFDDAHRLLMVANDDNAADVLHQSLLYRYIAELISCSEQSGASDAKDTKRSGSKVAYLDKAISFIENQYSQKTTVQDIAQAVGLDSTYLSALFKQHFGLSLQSFLLQFRMNRAAELLANKALTISDIARSVGYTDPFVFSKMFKKSIGSSPRAYRENLK
ncbi:AraC family transcriptional regulator [Paenibacillus sp. NEAU-GSW1]|uniref:AraC family transcriptional regulator n=1 Tax=Paenibacillus sp. NEAU-GSW1 TaxID=2682486 RepID=UPI0012E2657B|nr:AraC family transcriptional regulator [Paenibacillus sp. NEAU-GSW1]MUT67695.1 helix-turn-helix domain-containing protein [Paenibacillus sp. NEAU-GSW1]